MPHYPNFVKTYAKMLFMVRDENGQHENNDTQICKKTKRKFPELCRSLTRQTIRTWKTRKNPKGGTWVDEFNEVIKNEMKQAITDAVNDKGDDKDVNKFLSDFTKQAPLLAAKNVLDAQEILNDSSSTESQKRLAILQGGYGFKMFESLDKMQTVTNDSNIQIIVRETTEQPSQKDLRTYDDIIAERDNLKRTVNKEKKITKSDDLNSSEGNDIIGEYI